MDKPEPDFHFKLMPLAFKLRDLFSPRKNVLKEVGIKPGFHVLDYGCGLGGYLTAASELVGRSGQIYALDIHPAGNEPMLSPKYNLTRSVYRMPHPDDMTPPACYDYESRIYANYTASPDAEVSIHVELTGANAWLSLRVVWNEYRDWVGVTLTGAQDGWCAASGNLVAGEGRY